MNHMRGRVKFWNRHFEFGFIEPDGLNANRKDEKVYFNKKLARYQPVTQGDIVEFELRDVPITETRGPCALWVRRAER